MPSSECPLAYKQNGFGLPCPFISGLLVSSSPVNVSKCSHCDCTVHSGGRGRQAWLRGPHLQRSEQNRNGRVQMGQSEKGGKPRPAFVFEVNPGAFPFQTRLNEDSLLC